MSEMDDMTDHIAARRYEGCCRAAVDSEGFAHDHTEWFAKAQTAEAEVARLTAELAEALADRDEAETAHQRMYEARRDSVHQLVPVFKYLLEVQKSLPDDPGRALHALRIAVKGLEDVADRLHESGFDQEDGPRAG